MEDLSNLQNELDKVVDITTNALEMWELGSYEVKQRVQKLVFKTFGLVTFINYVQDGFNEIRSSQEDICKKLLKNDAVRRKPESLYFVLVNKVYD